MTQSRIMWYRFIALAVALLFSTSAYSQTTPRITSFHLLDIQSSEDLLGPLHDGQYISPSLLDNHKVALVVKTSPPRVRKVVFQENHARSHEDYAQPYSLAGDDGGNFYRWVPSSKHIEISAIPFDRETHTKGIKSTIKLFFESKEEATTSSSPHPEASLPYSKTPQTPELPDEPCSPFIPPAVYSFPGAVGFGVETTAGSSRGGHDNDPEIFKVTSLAESGSGTLAECISSSLPRTCLFEVGGTIDLDEPIKILNPFITIAGQTAPSPGITLRGAGLQVRTHDVLIQHLRIEVGDNPDGQNPRERDGIVVWGTSSKPAYNIVLDHLTVLWAIDENISTYGNVSDVTISNSLIAEALHDSIHPKGPHSKGILVGEGAQRVSIIGNLLAHNQDRNPRLNPGSATEVVNNLVYNWGGTSGWNVANLSDTKNTGNPTFLNFIGNVFIAGADSSNVHSVYASSIDAQSKVYVLDNLGPRRTSNAFDEWDIVSLSNSYQSLTPTIALSNLSPIEASEVEAHVLQNAGARPSESRATDLRIKNEVIARTGQIKNCLQGCSKAVGSIENPSSANRTLHLPSNPFQDDDLNGYTNLEDWIFSFPE